MKVKNLKSGVIYKDFTALCEALGIKPKSGYSKKKLLEDLKRYVDYSQDGRKFIIHKTYPSIQPRKKDSRSSGNNNLYAKYIELILTQYLAIDRKGMEVSLTKQELWNILGMTNPKFGKYLAENSFMQQHPEISQIDMNRFKSSANYKMTQVLDTALRSLRNKRLLSYFVEVIIVPNQADKPEYVATYEEVKLIDAIEQGVLEQLGFHGVYQVYNANKDKEFYALVNKELKKHGWNNTYRRYRLVYTQEKMVTEVSKLEVEIDNKMQLNSNLITYLNKNCEKNYKEFVKRRSMSCGTISKSDFQDSTYFKDRCIENHKILSEEFLRYIFDPEVKKS